MTLFQTTLKVYNAIKVQENDRFKEFKDPVVEKYYGS